MMKWIVLTVCLSAPPALAQQALQPDPRNESANAERVIVSCERRSYDVYASSGPSFPALDDPDTASANPALVETTTPLTAPSIPARPLLTQGPRY